MRARLAEIGRATETAGAAPDAPVPVAATAPISVVSAIPRADVGPSEPMSSVTAVPSAPVAARAVEPPVVEAPPSAPVTMAAVAPTVTPRAARVTGYWVQVGAFSNVDKAMKVVTALDDEPVSLITAPGQSLMRVLVGPFAERAAAASKLRQIRARGYDAFIAEASK
jgi:cell division septation protein DedD